MIGLLYLAFFLLYLLITVVLTWAAVKVARRRGIAGWKWGIPVALLMYLLVFWDWIPTAVLHSYYCSEEAGLRVYTTSSEWEEENPGVSQTLTTSDSSSGKQMEGITIYALNERFALVNT